MSYPYATFDDVLTRYRPLRTIIGAGSYQVASEDVSSRFIHDAQGVIDGFLANRYAIPLTPTPLVTHICSDLAIFNIIVEHLPSVPDFMQGRYDRAMKYLEMLNAGSMTLGSQSAISSGDNYAWSSTMDYHPIFEPSLDPLDQAVDRDRIEDSKFDRIDDHGVDLED